MNFNTFLFLVSGRLCITPFSSGFSDGDFVDVSPSRRGKAPMIDTIKAVGREDDDDDDDDDMMTPILMIMRKWSHRNYLPVMLRVVLKIIIVINSLRTIWNLVHAS